MPHLLFGNPESHMSLIDIAVDYLYPKVLKVLMDFDLHIAEIPDSENVVIRNIHDTNNFELIKNLLNSSKDVFSKMRRQAITIGMDLIESGEVDKGMTLINLMGGIYSGTGSNRVEQIAIQNNREKSLTVFSELRFTAADKI